MAWWLGSCPRCKGDLFVTSDRRKLTASCLQCSRAFEDEQVQALSRTIPEQPNIPVWMAADYAAVGDVSAI